MANDIPTIYLFSHGVANYGARQAQNYAQSIENNPYLFSQYDIVITFNFPDAVCIPIKLIKPWNASLGQENEIDALKKKYESLVSYLKKMGIKKYNLVLVGVSRGATVILNFLALHQPKNIAAAILESPFARAKDLGNELLLKAAFWKYNKNGTHCINIIHNIDKNIPVLFICSREDQRVPYSSTVALYKTLQEVGHTNSYIYIAPKGKHYDILWNKDKKIGYTYQYIVNGFLKRYKISHNQKMGTIGQFLFLNYCSK